MKGKTGASYFLVLVLAVVASIVTSALQRPHSTIRQRSSLYDRVVKTGKIRCGYVVYPPGCIKDPNTGKLSGISVDLLEKVGQNLGLKVEWTEEVGWGSMIEGLQTDRYDMIGAAIWANTTRAKQVDFSMPFFYSGVGVYVRKGDKRFAENLSAIDSPSVKIATIDGEMADVIARADFPSAERVSYPQTSDVSHMLLALATRKADVGFAEPYIVDEFLKSNPGSIENLAMERPIRVFPNTMLFRRGEYEFKAMLDTAIGELVNSGYVDKLIDKYDTEGTLYRNAYPYRMQKRSVESGSR